VLLIDGNTVYYRVNRSIHSARIGSERLEDHTLLVEDDVVPDIHWAFFGPPPPAEHTPWPDAGAACGFQGNGAGLERAAATAERSVWRG
jgi:hypothetical protein